MQSLFTSISTENAENDCCSSFFSKTVLNVHRRLIKCIRTNYVNKKPFFHLSVCVIDLFNFSKNSKDTGPI